MSETAIRISDFYFAYLNSDLVLKDINLEIQKGSFTAIAGPSGAGKTTLCKAMTGIVPHYYGGRYHGSVEVLGEDLKGRKISEIAMRVGIMMDDYESQMVSLTAGEEIAFGLLNHGFSPDEVDARVSQALEDVGLPGRENYQLDELVSALDPDGARSLYALVHKIYQQHQMTVVVVEHDLNYLLPYMTDLVLISGGEARVQGKFEEAARAAFAQEDLRENLPELWLVKLGLEERYPVKLGDWRTEEEAEKELLQKFQGGGKA